MAKEWEFITRATPSPGSPQRQIDKFGCISGSGVEYASKYFKYAFNWLKQ